MDNLNSILKSTLGSEKWHNKLLSIIKKDPKSIPTYLCLILVIIITILLTRTPLKEFGPAFVLILACIITFLLVCVTYLLKNK